LPRTKSIVFPTVTPILGSNPVNNPFFTLNPIESQILTPGQIQTFTITFTKPVAFNKYSLSVTKSAPRTTEQKVDFTSSFGDRSLQITLTEVIQPTTTYTITLQEKGSSNILFSVFYNSGNPPLPTIAQNNTQLQQYLPYETDSYILSYLPSRNIYIFNFKYDSTLSGGINDQYESAKKAAIEFITSKGININSIVIEWRHS
jgi:hypothetical protein